MTHAHSYFKARKELRAIIYFIEKRTNYISNSAEIQCSSSSHQCSWTARAIMSSHMVSRYVYCSYSCVCRVTVCMLHVHMNLRIIRTFLNYDTNFKNNNTCIPLLQTLSGQDDITHTHSL